MNTIRHSTLCLRTSALPFWTRSRGASQTLLNVIHSQPCYRTITTLKECYDSFGAVPVVFEIARLSGIGGHAHVQVVPVPLRLKDEVEAAFSTDPQVVWEQDAEAALREAAESKRDYFRVTLPDGRKMVHMISGYFNLQFGRWVLGDRCIGSNGQFIWV